MTMRSGRITGDHCLDCSNSKRSQGSILWQNQGPNSDVVTIKVFTSPSWATSLSQARKKQVVSFIVPPKAHTDPQNQNIILNKSMVNRSTLQLILSNLSFECRTLVARTRLPKLLASINGAYIPSAEVFGHWHH